MGTPDQNPLGYDRTNLVDKAGLLQVQPLLIHGLADTNVHLQNTINFIQMLNAADKGFNLVPLVDEDHHYEGDGLAACLAASSEYFAMHIGGKSH
jgi:dipeptidyl-peptidase-4